MGRFEREGYLRTGWFTAGMDGFDKLNSHFEWYLFKIKGLDDPKGYIDTYMRTMEDPETWTFIGRADKFGRNVLPLGLDDKGFSRGVASMGVEFEYRFYTDDERYSPVGFTTLDKYIKLPLPGRAWVLNVPLDAPNENGWSPQEMDDYLARQTYAPAFARVVIGGRTYRARFAQHQAVEGSGEVPYKNATVNIVATPLPDEEGAQGGFMDQFDVSSFETIPELDNADDDNY